MKKFSFVPAQLKGREVSGFTAIGKSNLVRAYLPYVERNQTCAQPRRKSLEAPLDNNTFVKPIKQCFVKNPRLMPMTRIMLTLLAGWAGQGGPIETTIGIVAKHLGRCRRQVFRYLKDAVEEGYLYYTRTKDRIGRYTGIKVRLNFPAIRFTSSYKARKSSKTIETLDVTYPSETNKNFIYNKDLDPQIWERLEGMALSLGVQMPET